MLLELELGLLLAVEAAKLLTTRRAAPAANPAPVPPTLTPAPVAAPGIEIVKRSGAEWVRIGHRHAAHPDVREALATPGLAVRHADGRIEGGDIYA